MKRISQYLMVTMLMVVFSAAYARDDLVKFSIDEAMTSSDAETKLGAGIKFFFGDQKHPNVSTKIGTYTANKKTNAFGKSDLRACSWAFLSAMVSLQDRAIAEGGDAVVNIRSYYKKHDFSSATEFECGAGSVVAGVTLVGEVVKLTK